MPLDGNRTTQISRVDAQAFRIPTETAESDGTLEWDATTLIVARVRAGGATGIGYTYTDATAASLIAELMAPLLTGRDALATPQRMGELNVAVRNLGREGLCATALSAIDVALWDLKAKLLRVPLATLLGLARDAIDAYGSGGFTSYDNDRLQAQLAGWARDGLRAVKMKVGRDPKRDVDRVRAARATIGPDALFVDANGAYTRKQALDFAQRFAEQGVSWFEEPVSSDDLDGLRLLRDRAPPGMSISAGEYGYTSTYFRRMLEANAVDVLQADATRCGGVSGFLAANALCEAACLPLSSHCAPALHTTLCCCATRAIHLEWFHDHVRIEQQLFDGAPRPRGGRIGPDLSRPGLGIEFRDEAAKCYRIS